MKQLLQFLVVVTFLVWSAYGLYAQQGFVAFGGEATGSGGSQSFSGGQVDFRYYFSGAGSLSLGLQQSWNEITGIPPVLLIPSTIVANGQSSCFNAAQTVTVAGDGKLFIVQNGGHANIIAGQNIFLKPGTLVQPGGSLHAYISTEWCDNAKSIVATTEEISLLEASSADPQDGSTFFKVFPNPTPGNLTLELMDFDELTSILIEIFNAQGNLVFDNRMPSARQYFLSLSDQQPGMYLIRVLKDNDLGTKKIIKY